MLAAYREPLGGHPLLFVALPVEKVEPTPFQRDVSDAHVRKLTVAMDKTKRYLDPIIAVREGDGYMTPNGGHRLTALKELGAKSVLALLVPERSVAYQILALNIEKAHNLREKALEVVRMYRDLAGSLDPARAGDGPRVRGAGARDARLRLRGAAAALGRRLRAHPQEGGRVPRARSSRRRSPSASGARRWCSPSTTRSARRWRGSRSAGFDSPYLKAFVVARVNPLRFMKGGAPPFDELFAQMTKRARGMDPGKVKREDVARSGGAPAEAE